MKERRTPWRGLALAFAFALLSAPAVTWSAGAQPPSNTAYPTTSWALGVALPEGAKLQGGGSLVWEEVSNVTAMVVLPDMANSSARTYVVVSLMNTDGAVLQVAAGTQSNSTGWLAYSWYIPDSAAVPLTYDWMLNGSAPTMGQGARVTISLFRAEQTWDLEVKDLDTGAYTVGQFPGGVVAPIDPGDQEVFALESYSRSQATFENMGNLTLVGLIVNGQRVVSGFYSYGDWSTTRNPIFAVGGSGAAPPSFISLRAAGNGSMVWAYDTAWQGTEGGGFAEVIMIVMLVAALVFVASFMLLAKKFARRALGPAKSPAVLAHSRSYRALRAAPGS